jgi:hypothetical protein
VRHVGALLTATALLLALGGCTDEPEEVVRTSGALADGFEIEPGSGLVGAVFPLRYGIGHQAVLRVDGDLPEVFERYVRQAEDLGYPMETLWGDRPERQWCNDPEDGNIDDEPNEGPFGVECEAYTMSTGESSVAVRGLADVDGSGYIHLEVQTSNDTGEPSPLASDGPVAPATDDEIAADLTPFGEPPVRLVEGSELLSTPFPATCITGGYMAVLQVTDDLVPVLRGYLEQFTDAGFTGEGLVRDEDEVSVYTGQAGGGGLDAISKAGDPSYVLLERCND